ncbi:MAG TPA: TadE family protein [Candidatus Anoxymicrobiaceae bacterium]|jgi:TadE-like protein
MMRAFTTRAGQGGQAAVEMAIVIPVLMLMVVAVCQVALALNCYLVVTGASRDGARRAAETNDSQAAKKAALASAGGLPGEPVDVEVSFAQGRDKGCPVTVTVVYRVPLLLPGLEHIIPTPSFKRSTTMSLERSQ